ncbi:MAG: acyl-CoA dehydrogenase family protein, partial [Actinomycetota bacterium]|nr:acyl-CoA dehydrogenase family protein [Actinomycetota bacterium]
TDARVEAGALIGGVHQGWAVANTTLANERAGLGSGGGGGGGFGATPGTVAGHLERRAGDFAPRARNQAGGRAPSERPSPRAMRGSADPLISLARATGRNLDPAIRQALVRLYTWGELGRLNGLRLKAVRESGGDIPGMPNIAKLSMSNIVRLSRDVGLEIAGAAGTLHGYDEAGKASLEGALPDPLVSSVTEMALLAQAPPIYGGTDQIQRNIIGERVLGLPKEPSNDRTTPFAELAKNA